MKHAYVRRGNIEKWYGFGLLTTATARDLPIEWAASLVRSDTTLAVNARALRRCQLKTLAKSIARLKRDAEQSRMWRSLPFTSVEWVDRDDPRLT